MAWRDEIQQLRVEAQAPRALLASYRLGRPRRDDPSRPAAAVTREELQPSSAPFPRARYVFLVGTVPEKYEGRSASILRKAQLFTEREGVECEIVMTHFKGDLGQRTARLRDRGALVPGVTLRTLDDGSEDGPSRRRDRLFGTTSRVHAQLDRLVGDDRVFLSVEARFIHHLFLTYRNPNVQQVYVLHEQHLKPPYRDPLRVQRIFRPLLHRHQSVGAVVLLTHTQRADIERVIGPQENVFVLPHPVPPASSMPKATGVERDARLAVMLARLDHQKRVGDAISMFARVVQRVPDARLEIYGHGPEQADLQRQIDTLGVGASVTLAGYTEDPLDLYQRAAALLMTSRHEALPLVLLESLSLGCPPVSYDIRYGPSDVIEDGVNGFLVEEGDTATMADRVTELLTDDALRDRMSRAALASAAGMGEDAAVARWSALFNRLAAQAWEPV